jgi:hypothetical protein
LLTNQGAAQTQATARFSRLLGPDPARVVEAGGCTFTEFSGPSPSEAEPPRAGKIVVGKRGGEALTLEPQRIGGDYAAVTASTALFAPGDIIDVTAEGDSVPAFAGEVVAPGALAVTQPAKPPAGQPVVVKRGSPFEVTWTPGPAGAVANLLLLADGTGGHSFAARCAVDLSAGRATFAPEGLAIMPAGPGTVRFASLQKTVVKAGPSDVSLLVVAGATDAAGAETMFSLPATFE